MLTKIEIINSFIVLLFEMYWESWKPGDGSLTALIMYSDNSTFVKKKREYHDRSKSSKSHTESFFLNCAYKAHTKVRDV